MPSSLYQSISVNSVLLTLAAPLQSVMKIKDLKIDIIRDLLKWNFSILTLVLL